MSNDLRTYPHGVPCWVDTEQPDPEAAREVYGALFGWTFGNALPPGAPAVYLIAKLSGQDVCAIGQGAAQWNTYIAVRDADVVAAEIEGSGGSVLSPPQDAGPGGRLAVCADPGHAQFRLWQANKRLGAQVVNSPNSWNFSNLRTPDPDAAFAFYATIFGWKSLGTDNALGMMVQVPGYGDHLASTVDPDIYQRQVGAPPGFADVVAGIEPTSPGDAPNWHVKFSVADRDETARTAEKLGAKVLLTHDTQWTREAVIEDAQGARFSVSEFLHST